MLVAPAPCKDDGKSTGFDGPNTCPGSDMSVGWNAHIDLCAMNVLVVREVPDLQPQRTRQGESGRQDSNHYPKIPSPAQVTKPLVFGDNKKEPPKSTVPKAEETTPTVALTRCYSRGGGGGDREASQAPTHRAFVRRLPSVPQQLQTFTPQLQRLFRSLTRPRATRPSAGRSLRGKQKVFRFAVFPKKSRAHQVLLVGGWRLAVGDWRLVVVGGGWWRLAPVGWGLVDDGGWQWLAVGGWWRLAVGGGWWLAVDGPLGRSLGAVLNKKKSSPFRTPPASPPFLGGAGPREPATLRSIWSEPLIRRWALTAQQNSVLLPQGKEGREV